MPSNFSLSLPPRSTCHILQTHFALEAKTNVCHDLHPRSEIFSRERMGNFQKATPCMYAGWCQREDELLRVLMEDQHTGRNNTFMQKADPGADEKGSVHCFAVCKRENIQRHFVPDNTIFILSSERKDRGRRMDAFCKRSVYFVSRKRSHQC